MKLRFILGGLALLCAGCANHSIVGVFTPPPPYPVPIVGYKVLRGTTRSNLEPIFTTPFSSFTDTTVQKGVTYYYTVTAVYGDGSESAPLDVRCANNSDGAVQCGP